MKKKILCLLLSLMIVSITAFTPILGATCSYVSITYAEDEEPEEVLNDTQKQIAAIATYLNNRKGYIRNITEDVAPVAGVAQIMQTYIDSYEFWKNWTHVTHLDFIAGIMIKYRPFQITLNGTAIQALNDLYNYLIETGKLPNLENDNSGGETNDTIYNGYYGYMNNLFFVLDDVTAGVNISNGLSAQYVTTGNPVSGVDGEFLYTRFNSLNQSITDYWSKPMSQLNTQDITVSYAADYTLTRQISKTNGTSDQAQNYLVPFLSLSSVPLYSKDYGNVGCACRYHLRSESANIFHEGFIYFNPYTNKFYIDSVNTFHRNSRTVTDINIQFHTNDFEKEDPEVPEGEDTVTYTPIENTTNNTFNTYNDYIVEYSKVNTTINYEYSNDPGGGDEPSNPGGETPPWDNSGTAGTLTPDGNGGYDLSLPDITIPDLDINWSISGLTEKFPFSIPFDLLAFFTVLNAQPETPKIEGTIDLGIVDWDIDWDLHAFDTLAALLRNLEFIGFCIALILITRNIIKG